MAGSAGCLSDVCLLAAFIYFPSINSFGIEELFLVLSVAIISLQISR